LLGDGDEVEEDEDEEEDEAGSLATALVRVPIRRPSFALTRPPGHHAGHSQAMGFCIFNFAVIAARYALDKLGCQRVAILDLDAHHGNGNEEAVRTEPSMCYASFHQQDSFPMTGLDPSDHGPHGNLLNVPIRAYSEIKTYLTLLDDKVLPFLTAFGPDLVIVSAGYDCLVDDPLAQLALGPRDFEAVGERLLRAFGREKIMFGLEGGYEPENVAAAIVATLKPFL
jgi:acetoin utilization deacetylase AcuC-like enzyme